MSPAGTPPDLQKMLLRGRDVFNRVAAQLVAYLALLPFALNSSLICAHPSLYPYVLSLGTHTKQPFEILGHREFVWVKSAV